MKKINPANQDLDLLASKYLIERDREFFNRVWSTPAQVYEDRLRALGMTGLESVLDAGSGFGQWSVALSKLNQRVNAIELDPTRVQVLSEMVQIIDLDNISVEQGSMEELPYRDESFDAVFSYSVIYFTDYRVSLREVHRVLRPKGKIYLNCNSIGWYVYNLVEGHNSSISFDSSKMAKQALEDSLAFYNYGESPKGNQIAIPSKFLVSELEKLGFENIQVGADGLITLDNDIAIESFYPADYFGLEGVYEVFATKNG